jgi:alpha-L-rhamnosidase
MMEERAETDAKIREGGDGSYPAIPAHQKVRILFDQGYLTTAYPELTVSGGRGATVSLGYAESLYQPGGSQKGNRDEVEGKIFVGYHDVFLPDGGERRLFRTLWWRTWRYLELTIETGDEPLTVAGMHGVFTAYPFERKAKLETGSAELDKMLDVGWRTARLCAHETYMDCPYYEQLQYVGDTRIQVLVSLYMTDDARLPRNAIEQIFDSRTPEGATFSRYPSRLQQYIPGFSLWWIGMLHDYHMYVDDPEFVRQMLPGVQAVLSFYESHQKPGGSLGPMPWWNYLDWTSWQGGVPPSTPNGSSAPADLQLLLAYQWAVDLGLPYQRKSSELAAAIQKLYWNSGRHLYADTPDGATFSQQTNILAILAGLTKGTETQALMEGILSDESLTKCSLYFRHYLFTALNRAHEGDRYLTLLDPWRQMLKEGLTTWAETEDPTRSDCHAWSASPNYELFHTILGIDSAAPGFHRVSIRPSLGTLTTAGGEIPHPKGSIRVHLQLSANGKLQADIELPPDTPGDFIWKGQSHPLQPGKSRLTL